MVRAFLTRLYRYFRRRPPACSGWLLSVFVFMQTSLPASRAPTSDDKCRWRRSSSSCSRSGDIGANAKAGRKDAGPENEGPQSLFVVFCLYMATVRQLSTVPFISPCPSSHLYLFVS